MTKAKNSKSATNGHIKARNIVPILGVGVDSARRSQLLNLVLLHFLEKKEVSSSLKSGSKYIVTPNPEIVYRGHEDPEYKAVLNEAALSLPDGVGTVWAMELQKTNLPSGFLRIPALVGEAGSCLFDVLSRKSEAVVPGRVFFTDLLEISQKNRYKVFLLGGRSMVAERAAQKIENMGIEVSWSSGPWLDQEGKPATDLDQALEKETIKKINDFKPDILFVAFGPPKQEFWLARNKSKLKNVKVSMVVGGTFDYFVGDRPLPPKFLESLGLEWFWRLFTQVGRPNHFQRIWTAVFLFPLEVLKEKYNEA